MTRTGTIALSVLGIISSALLLFCGACVAIFSFALSVDAPHAWKGDGPIGLIYGLVALALIIGAVLLLRGSIRRARSLRQVRMLDGNRDKTRTH
jgi:TRAP-type C4-dicarboxylate transport system permease small subunit